MASTTFIDGQTPIEASWLQDVNDLVYNPITTIASDVSNTPAGNITATTVQAAINELDTEKAPTAHTHTGVYEPVITNLPVSQGGVGITSYTAGDLLYATGATTLTKLPKGTASQILKMNSGATAPEWATNTSTLTLGTPWVYSTGVSNIDFDTIPSTVKQITVNISGLSTTGTAIPMLRLKDSGGEETTGYIGNTSAFGGGVGTLQHVTGFLFTNSHAAADYIYGQIIITNLSGNIWTVQGGLTTSATYNMIVHGTKELSSTLTGIRITTTDAFDAGTINILYQ